MYSVAEADAMLPELRERLARIREARETLIRGAELVSRRVEEDPGGVAGDPAHFEASRILRTELEHLAERGIVLRDPQTGLVDFPGLVDDRRVWLCWRVGEERVAHYHELDAGFLGRRPL